MTSEQVLDLIERMPARVAAFEWAPDAFKASFWPDQGLVPTGPGSLNGGPNQFAAGADTGPISDADLVLNPPRIDLDPIPAGPDDGAAP